MNKIAKLALVVLCLFSAGCAPKRVLSKRIVIPYILDFRKYAAEGFYISPTDYVGEYEPVANLVISVFPGEIETFSYYWLLPGGAKIPYSKEEAAVRKSEPHKHRTIKYEDIPADELLEMLVKYAKEKGANAMVNCSVKGEWYTYLDAQGELKQMLIKYDLSGFAIKRK